MDSKSGVLSIVAIGLAFGLGLAGLGLGIGLAISIIGGHISLTIPLLIPIATVAATLGILGGTITITVNIFKKAIKEPFYWLIPVLSIFSGLIVDLCKEFYDKEGSLMKAGFGAVTLLLFFCGGILWKKNESWSRIIGSILYAFPILLTFLKYANTKGLSLLDSIKTLPLDPSALISLILLILLFGISAFLSYKLREE